jgi:Zn-dependent M28 family amino/carboxypeptidase
MEKAEPELPILAADVLPIAPPDFLRSDHAPFLIAGLPAVMLTNTANFRNPNYHKPTDTVATLDLDRLAKVVRAVTAATKAIAETPEAAPVSSK